MAKKRTQATAGLATEGTGRKKRKAAETATAKTSMIAAGDDSDLDFDDDVLETETETPFSKAKTTAKTTTKAKAKGTLKAKAKTLPKRDEVEDMPLVAPGFRHFEGFSDTVRNTEIAALTKSKPDMEQSRKYGFTLKPVILTDGPLAGETLLLLRPTATFRFLDLPPEIRNIVYSYLIDEPKTLKIDSHKPVGKPRRPVVSGFKYRDHKSSGLIWDKANGKWIGQSRTAFDFLCISKQVQAETARLLYGDTTFTFWDWSDADLFLDTIGSMRRYLRHVEIPAPSRKGYGRATTALKRLGDAFDLQTLSTNHNEICPAVANRWTIGLEAFVRMAMPMFSALHKSFSATTPPRNVLDIIKVQSEIVKRGMCNHCDGQGRCWECNKGKDHDMSCQESANCKVTCKEHDAHAEDLADQIREMVAKELKIKA